jgi:ATP-dependent Clp protease protease subunit
MTQLDHLLAVAAPRALVGKVQNDRPPALPIPARQDVHALAPAPNLERWVENAAGLRPVALERGDNVITIFGAIGEDFWEEGITAKSVSRQLRAIGGEVEVQINSPGGDVFEGFAIYNALREHPHPVNVKIIGMAASAASVIAMAGDNVQIGAAAFVMIHNCWVLGIGNRHDLRELADWLEPFDKALNSVYVARTGKKPDEIGAMLDEETWLSGAQAIEMGFADDLLPADQVEEDTKAKAKDKDTHAVRAMELSLISSGMTRAQARERIRTIKGTPGAALELKDGIDTPGAVDTSQAISAFTDLLSNMKKPLFGDTK